MNPATLLKDPVLSRDGFRCVYCGADLLADVDAFVCYVRDHLLPHAAGGPTHVSNLVTACCACDRLKSGRPVVSVQHARVVIEEQRRKWATCLEEVRRVARQEPDAVCTITVINEVLGTRDQFVVPTSIEDVQENCLPVETASDWLRWYGQDTETEPIAVSIRKGRDEVVVRWHAVDDPEAARVAMQDVLNGSWRGELL